MAEPLNRIGRRHVAAGLLFVTAAFASGLVAAQVDPTRPPDVPVVEPAGAAAPQPVLKSILISNKRTEAIIGEKVVHPGEKVGNAYVVRISESEVILRDEHGLQTLKLFPGIEKRHVADDNKVTDVVPDTKDKSKK